ncbi:unnamed protein product, partial [Clonostachys rosea]
MGAPKNIVAESIFATVNPAIHKRPTRASLNDDEGTFLVQANFSWSPIIESSPNDGRDYTVLPVDVSITPALSTGFINDQAEQSNDINYLLYWILASTTALKELSWSGQIFLVIPKRAGYIVQTKLFQHRAIDFSELGLVHDRTTFAQEVKCGPTDDIESVFGSYLVAIARKRSNAGLCDEDTLRKEIDVRLGFEWRSDQHPEHETLADVSEKVPKLSARGTDWSKFNIGDSQDLYDPVNNPNGVVRLTNAHNGFLHDELAEFINSHNHFDKGDCSYGKGDAGTLRLRTAMANHLNEYFVPVSSFDAEQITFAAGITSLSEISAMVLCDPGDAIMIGRPCHSGFEKDLCMRTGVNIEWVSFAGDYQFSLLEVADYDAAFEEAKARGSNIRALIICNPHNPLGQCYPPDTLKAIMEFCASKGIHLISDEVYALSTYERVDRPSEKFTSVRSIDTSGIIDPRQVHVLYGMSKDYGAGGMRLGCVISQNTDFTKAVQAVSRFASPSKFSMALAAKFLEDRQFVHQFLQKSQSKLLQGRLYAEELLKQTDIPFHDKGNSGLAIWLDLRGFIPSLGANYDPWFAEQLISKRFEEAGVLVDGGAVFSAPTAGRFRIVFSVDSETLREGIK